MSNDACLLLVCGGRGSGGEREAVQTIGTVPPVAPPPGHQTTTPRPLAPQPINRRDCSVLLGARAWSPQARIAGQAETTPCAHRVHTATTFCGGYADNSGGGMRIPHGCEGSRIPLWYPPDAFAGSSNGRTPDSGSGSRGSSPCPAARGKPWKSGAYRGTGDPINGGRGHIVDTRASPLDRRQVVPGQAGVERA